MKHLTIILLLINLSVNGYACSCTGTSEYSNGEITIEWYNNHPFVFESRIDSVYTEDFSQKVFLTVLKIYKGSLPEKVTISPPLFGSSCSFDLRGEEGETYIVYGYIDQKGVLNSHFCNGTKRVYSKKELDTLKIANYHGEIKIQELEFLESIAAIRDGKVDGKYSNGKICGEGNFIKGLPAFKWIYYGYEGNIISEGHYYKGLKDGLWVEYGVPIFNGSKGEIKYESISMGNFVDGLKEGEWKTFRTNGDYWYSSNYEKGVFKK